MKNKRLIWLVAAFAFLDLVVVRIAHRSYELKACAHRYMIKR